MSEVAWHGDGWIPPLLETLVPPTIRPDLSEPPTTTYGEREDDPTTSPALTVEPRYVRGVGWSPRVWRYVPQRRAVYTTWRDRDGQRWGERTWESAAARLELLS